VRPAGALSSHAERRGAAATYCSAARRTRRAALDKATSRALTPHGVWPERSGRATASPCRRQQRTHGALASASGAPPAGLTVALAVVARDRKGLQRESARLNNATAYAEAHACPLFVEPGQATLPADRRPASAQPNLFEELSAAEVTAVRARVAVSRPRWGARCRCCLPQRPPAVRPGTEQEKGAACCGGASGVARPGREPGGSLYALHLQLRSSLSLSLSLITLAREGLYSAGAPQVRDYLLAQPDLNLTNPDNAGMAANTLFMVELLPPPKADALATLDDGAPAPPRQARSPQPLRDAACRAGRASALATGARSAGAAAAAAAARARAVPYPTLTLTPGGARGRPRQRCTWARRSRRAWRSWRWARCPRPATTRCCARWPGTCGRPRAWSTACAHPAARRRSPALGPAARCHMRTGACRGLCTIVPARSW